jgi:3',5'-cyclic AMP phosphodiesterase CpdA
MVGPVPKWFALFLVLVILLAACNMLVMTNDISDRFSYRAIFRFLSDADRNPYLGDAYSFIVISDVHNSGRLAEFSNPAILQGAKFIVITGDISNEGSDGELERFIQTAATFPVPCYPVAGNHDIYDNNGAPWKKHIGSFCYRIDDSSPAGSTTLFVLDSANAVFGTEQLDWFENETQGAKPIVFVFTHNNFFVDSMFDAEHLTDIRERARVMYALKNRCRALFSGHLHKRVVKESGGVKYISLEDFYAFSTYCRVYVSPTGVRYEFENLPPLP